MTDRQIVPWFGGKPKTVLAIEDTDKVAYSWATVPGVPDEPKKIEQLLVWHNCDRSVWLADPSKPDNVVREYEGWTPAGVGLHDLISAEPLHIEASVYWPTCCGMHGFIRDGRWVSA